MRWTRRYDQLDTIAKFDRERAIRGRRRSRHLLVHQFCQRTHILGIFRLYNLFTLEGLQCHNTADPDRYVWEGIKKL
jgi:hypothetical protein